MSTATGSVGPNESAESDESDQQPAALPAATHRYLSDQSLAPLWAAVRARIERNRLVASGTVTVALDDDGAERLRGLLGGGAAQRGTVRIRLDVLDAALRRSAAAAGLVTVVTALTGPLIDRSAARDTRRDRWQQVWLRLDAALAAAGLADAEWVPAFADAIRRSGLLTRAGAEAAGTAVERASTALGLLARGGAFESITVANEGRWELAELASRATGDAHGLDDGRLAGVLVLRAAATALGVPPAETPVQRRALWARLGVTPDLVSGTVLAWGLRPPGADEWSAMLRARADLGVVTHLTLQELHVAGDPELSTADAIVRVCENPQVLQAAARAGAPGPLLCLSGNPTRVGWSLVRRIVAAGARLDYHGDFDWPGITIARRVFAAGATPWRMGAVDYLAAVDALNTDARLALIGDPTPTPWDPSLSTAMQRVSVAVHEEALLSILLSDLGGA